MANWPENGTENWNTAMLAYLAIEHNTDGSHKVPSVGGSMSIVSFDRDMTASTGSQVVTGVGFLPSFIYFFGGVDTTEIASWGAKGSGGSLASSQLASGVMDASGSVSIALQESAVKRQTAIVSAFGSDGFTLLWTKTGTTSAGTAHMIAICVK